MRAGRVIAGLVAVVVALALLVGCPVSPLSPDPPVSPPPVPEPPVSSADATRMLEQLAVVPRERGDSGYRRDAFGSRWKDIEGNGCDQRDDVLLRDVDKGQPFETGSYGRCRHDMLAGTWHDPYTGETLTFTDLKDQQQAQALQIDHIVPLSEAWKSGARHWPPQQRERFANSHEVLLAVDGPTNMSKGDHDPAGWRPRKEYQCEYAGRWIQIKRTWQLAVDPSEKRALTEMLGYC